MRGRKADLPGLFAARWRDPDRYWSADIPFRLVTVQNAQNPCIWWNPGTECARRDQVAGLGLEAHFSHLAR